jgi:hypothetical protein
MQRQAESDATKMVGAASKAKTTLDTQQLIKDCQSGNGWFPCMKLDDTNSCYCERVFRRSEGLAAHELSDSHHFVRAPTSTANLAKQLFHQLMQGGGGDNNTARLATANEVAPGRVTKAVNTSRFNFTLSDDAKQDAPHLLAHRIANREMLTQWQDLAHLTTYSNKSDGAGVYASIQQFLALRVLHEVNPRYPRCTESSQSVAGDGKGGCDRMHAEIGAKGKKQLDRSVDQTNADQHAAALVAEPEPAAVEEADVLFDADVLTFREWATQRGTFHTTALNREKAAVGG